MDKKVDIKSMNMVELVGLIEELGEKSSVQNRFMSGCM